MLKKTYEVRIPLIIREVVPEGAEAPKEFGLTIQFDVKATSEADAAAIIRERLSPTCEDP